MSRLPTIEEHCEDPAVVVDYINKRALIKERVDEAQTAAKTRLKDLNGLRSEFAKSHGLSTPGVDLILKLLEQTPVESARQFLRMFDIARGVTKIDDRLAGQADIEDHIRINQVGAASNLAEAVA